MINENIERESGAEQQPALQLIRDILPRYYEAYGENPRYEIERSIMIDGHEVAWLRYDGEISHDITGQGQEGHLFSGHELYCACKFTEGIGWRMQEDGRPIGLMGGDNCLKKQTALHMRNLELREEYIEMGLFSRGSYPRTEEVEAIILDLIEKSKMNEFIEGASAARSWNGHFYIQTIASITKLPEKTVWDVAHKMILDKKIQTEGAVVQSYVEVAAPTWAVYNSVQRDGYRVIASLPVHSKMPQTWQFEVFTVDKKEELVKIEMNIPQEPLMHESTFGPDKEDVNNAEIIMSRILEVVTQNPSNSYLS